MKSHATLHVLLGALALVTLACGSGNPVAEDDPGVEVPAVDPFEMNARLGRGVNFGNALEAPREGDWGVTLEALHFQRAREAGFATVRLPIRWSAHAQARAPYTIDETFFRRVDWAVDQALSRGLHLVLNVHHYEEMAANPRDHVDRWLAIWRQVASRYRGAPESLVFELMNEPNGALTAALWNEMVADAVHAIRATNPTRTLIVGPTGWNGVWALPTLQLPDDPHLIVTVHLYDPFSFTHQGAEWVDGSEAWLGTTWTGTEAETSALTTTLAQAAAYGTAHNRPVFLGEFGAYSRADLDSRVRWTAFVAREAERQGMSWAYWEFMAGFGIYNRQDDTWTTPLREALLPSASP